MIIMYSPSAYAGKRSRILLVSHMFPSRSHAGGLRILDLYAMIRHKCPEARLDLLTHHRLSVDGAIDDAYRIFDHIYLSPSEKLTPDSLQKLGENEGVFYDVIDIQFHHAATHLNAFKSLGGKILFTPMESQIKVMMLDMSAFFSAMTWKAFRRLKKQFRVARMELAYSKSADMVVCVSSADAAAIRKFCSQCRVTSIDTGLSHFEFSDALMPSFPMPDVSGKARVILYVAYFGSSTNINALRWYLEEVHPMVRTMVPDYTFQVVGRGDLSGFERYRDGCVELIGEVPEVAPYIREARIGIAPALSGSGFRGKINQYAVLGTPCVASPLSLQGLRYLHAESIIIGRDPNEFAEGCVKLLVDDDLNSAIARRARAVCLEHYTWESQWAAISTVYGLEN